MSEQQKRNKVFLAVVKPSKYGWIGKLGMADIAISKSSKDPNNLVISLLEQVQHENRGYQAPKPQQPQQPQARPYNQRPEAPPPYESGDPGPDDSDIPF